jgi:hypothetical protein
LRELPDPDNDAQNEDHVEHSFKKSAALLFRPDYQSVSGFELLVHTILPFGDRNAPAMPTRKQQVQVARYQSDIKLRTWQCAIEAFLDWEHAVPFSGRST